VRSSCNALRSRGTWFGGSHHTRRTRQFTLSLSTLLPSRWLTGKWTTPTGLTPQPAAGGPKPVYTTIGGDGPLSPIPSTCFPCASQSRFLGSSIR
jgi:hypothetical protein